MNNYQRLTAALAAAAVLFGTAGPALADKGGNGHGKGNDKHRISEKFEDMREFQWGLCDVTKMEVKGIFKGRDAKLFAPGAKINHQEAAVAALRLIDKEAAAQALTVAEVNKLLQDIPDQADIAFWARPAVAELVKLGFISPDEPFAPTKDATRLDTAVLLVKALGHEERAEAAMEKRLEFEDAKQIPAELRGYVYVAVQLRLITGYRDDDEVTFRPHQAVKRIEMAVMMGRADDLIDRNRQDEVRGTIKSVNVTADSLTITRVGGQEVTLTLADDASIFVLNEEASLPDLTAGMTVSLKLDAAGQVKYIEAKSAPEQGTAVSGTISELVAPTNTALGLITLADNIYPVAANAAVTVSGDTAAFADLREGDTVVLTVNAGLVTKIAVTRQAATVSGTVSAVTVPTSRVVGSIAINTTNYALPKTATVYVYGDEATFADIQVGDTATLTLVSNQVTKVSVTRREATVTGDIAALVAPTSTALGQIVVDDTAYPVSGQAVIKVNGSTATWADLETGDAVTLTVVNGQVTKVVATRQESTIDGTIAGLTAPTTTALGRIKIGTKYYPVSPSAKITLNGATVAFDKLKVGDKVALTIADSQVTKAVATREETVINGAIIGLIPAVAASGSTPASPAKIQVSYMKGSTITMATYNVDPTTTFSVNGTAVRFSGLRLGDAATLTLWGDLLVEVEATR